MHAETLSVIGMKCSGCTANITKAVTAINGVEGVDVSLDLGTVKFRCDDEATALTEVRAAINHLGYGIDDLKNFRPRAVSL